MVDALARFGPKVDARQLFEQDRATLLRLVRGLDPGDCERPTAAAPWLVRDVVAHLLGDDLSRLARTRDGHSPVGSQRGEPLAAFIHRFNDEWVQAARRVSPRLLLDMLAPTSPPVLALTVRAPWCARPMLPGCTQSCGCATGLGPLLLVCRLSP